MQLRIYWTTLLHLFWNLSGNPKNVWEYEYDAENIGALTEVVEAVVFWIILLQLDHSGMWTLSVLITTLRENIKEVPCDDTGYHLWHSEWKSQRNIREFHAARRVVAVVLL